MTDLEITRLCAEAMELDCVLNLNMDLHFWNSDFEASERYDPLHDNAQAMILVKKMRLFITPGHERNSWRVRSKGNGRGNCNGGHDLNRAICEFVAKMQSELAL